MTDPDNSQLEVYTLYEEMNTISEDQENRPTKILATTAKVKAIEFSKRRILNGLFDVKLPELTSNALLQNISSTR